MGLSIDREIDRYTDRDTEVDKQTDRRTLTDRWTDIDFRKTDRRSNRMDYK